MANTPPADLPDPLIFGTSFPDLRLVMRDGKQFAESRSNENLRTWGHAFDKYGTVTMASLIQSLGVCSAAHEAHDGWCPMLGSDSPRSDEDPWMGDWFVHTDGRPGFEACPGMQRLAEFCQTPAQRRFFDLWLEAQVRRLPHTWRDGVEEWPALERAAPLEQRLSFPALIPEVWLNYLGPRKSADDELHLAENPSRVDFVLLAEGRKCVIEIDGKSHFATYNRETNRWTPDERLYARNLKIERSLRRQGWEIHRFGDLEVNTCSDREFTVLTKDLPNNRQAWWDALGPDELPF